MILFHGTGGDRALVDKICDEGLRPGKHRWAHERTGVEELVFACTTPIGTRGGDPIDRLSKHARPRRGETLLHKLGYLARELEARRRDARRPVILE